MTLMYVNKHKTSAKPNFIHSIYTWWKPWIYDSKSINQIAISNIIPYVNTGQYISTSGCISLKYI